MIVSFVAETKMLGNRPTQNIRISTCLFIFSVNVCGFHGSWLVQAGFVALEPWLVFGKGKKESPTHSQRGVRVQAHCTKALQSSVHVTTLYMVIAKTNW